MNVAEAATAKVVSERRRIVAILWGKVCQSDRRSSSRYSSARARVLITIQHNELAEAPRRRRLQGSKIFWPPLLRRRKFFACPRDRTRARASALQVDAEHALDFRGVVGDGASSSLWGPLHERPELGRHGFRRGQAVVARLEGEMSTPDE